MEKQSYKRPVLYPVAIVFAVMSASWLVYNTAWRLDNQNLHRVLASISGTLLFLSVTFGPMFIYPVAYFRGARVRDRVLACFVNPLLWAVKENIRLSVSFSFGECLYYFLNPLNIWLMLGIVTQMGLMELVCRWRAARKGEEVHVFSPGPLAAFILGLCLTITLFAWGKGESVYVIFLSGYRHIFGSGL